VAQAITSVRSIHEDCLFISPHQPIKKARQDITRKI
jgi:hypothetical protein